MKFSVFVPVIETTTANAVVTKIYRYEEKDFEINRWSSLVSSDASVQVRLVPTFYTCPERGDA